MTFRKPSIANAIRSITAAADELRAVHAAEVKVIAEKEEQIAKLYDESNAAHDRRDRAAELAARFEALVA